MQKSVGILAAFAFGLKETLKHWKRLVPMTFIFYVPEFTRLAGLAWFDSDMLTNGFKFIVFFFLISMSLRLTAPAADMGPQKSSPTEFLKAKAIKWAVMGLAFALGFIPALGWIARQTGHFPLDFSGIAAFLDSCKESLAWVQGRPWLEQGILLAVASLPSYLVFYEWNFFGYAVIEKNLKALESLSFARRVARGAFWKLSVFYALCGALIALGLWLWTVGVLFTFPVTLLATVQIYRELRAQTEA